MWDIPCLRTHPPHSSLSLSASLIVSHTDSAAARLQSASDRVHNRASSRSDQEPAGTITPPQTTFPAAPGWIIFFCFTHVHFLGVLWIKLGDR